MLSVMDGFPGSFKAKAIQDRGKITLMPFKVIGGGVE